MLRDGGESRGTTKGIEAPVGLGSRWPDSQKRWKVYPTPPRGGEQKGEKW